jgi:hypothetical protein
MGWWGYNSYDNDGNFDELGHAVTYSGRKTKINREKATKLFKKKSFRIPGPVIWAIKRKIKVSKSAKKHACKQLKKELNNIEVGWTDPNKRRSAIKKELKMLKCR